MYAWSGRVLGRPRWCARRAALLPARLDQAVRGQPFQQRVQRRPLQPGLRDPGPELREHRVIKPRIIQAQP